MVVAAVEAVAEEEVEAVEAAVAKEDEEAAKELAAIVEFVIDFEQTFASSTHVSLGARGERIYRVKLVQLV